MPNYIERASVNIYDGTLTGTIEFQPRLNIIGGENGTLKTLLLQQLKGGASVPHLLDKPLRIHAVSPKRNSERRAALKMLQHFRQQNRTLDNVFSERLGAQIKQWGFENYPSLGELYYLVYEHRCRDGGNQQ
ncbi:unnamed protein product, partial [marine sediment metagenome]